MKGFDECGIRTHSLLPRKQPRIQFGQIRFLFACNPINLFACQQTPLSGFYCQNFVQMRRLNQQREVLAKEKETADKLAARAFAQSYLSDLIPSVFGSLTDHGFFYDPVERDVDEAFIPWLMDNVVEKLESLIIGRTVMDGLFFFKTILLNFPRHMW